MEEQGLQYPRKVLEGEGKEGVASGGSGGRGGSGSRSLDVREGAQGLLLNTIPSTDP